MDDREDCRVNRPAIENDYAAYECVVDLNGASKPNGPPAADAGLNSVPVVPCSAPPAENGARRVIVGSSPQAKALRERIAAYAQDDAPVMVTGETGVGKELVARQLHALGPRRRKPFLPINLSAVPETLAAAELFGHDKGAFTGAVTARDGAFAAADGGVLFLDEIGDMPLAVQAYLLRVLEDGAVSRLGGFSRRVCDTRLVSATNVDLRKSVMKKEFRLDLFYRVNGLVIDVPPLRERGEDILEIARAMIAAHRNERYRQARLTPKAADRLMAHPFPGNVRELRNVVTRALVHAQGGAVLPEHIMFDGVGAGCVRSAPAVRLDVPRAKDLVGRFLIMKALRRAGGNVTKAAELTGRSRGTVHALKKELEGVDFTTAYQAAQGELQLLFTDD